MKARKLFITALVFCLSAPLWAFAPYDDFNDLRPAGPKDRPEKEHCYVSCAHQRLEVLSAGIGEPTGACQASDWTLNPTQDFSMKVRYHYSPHVGPDGGVRLLLKTDDPQAQRELSICAGFDQVPYISFELRDPSGCERDWMPRLADEGTLYVSYTADTDTLCLSDTGFGSDNAWKEITGLLQQDWAGEPLSVELGGYSAEVALAAGDAYMDDFILESGVTIEAASLVVTSPAAGQLWVRGQTYPIEWTTDSPVAHVRIILFKAGVRVMDLVRSTLNTGTWSWAVPADLALGEDYKIRVIGVEDMSVWDYSSLFEICRPGDLYTPIKVLTPRGGSVWNMGSQYSIRWSGGDPGPNVIIKLYKAGVLVSTIAASTPNDGIYAWKPPYTLTPGADYRIKVISTDYAYVLGSTANFQIAIPPILVTAPTAGAQWLRGYPYTTRWKGGLPGQNVKIELLNGGVLSKTISASTLNDGVHSWTVPMNAALSTNCCVRVTYLPDTSMKDSSDAFGVYNSALGTWHGSWYDAGDSDALNMLISKNGVMSGSFVQPLDEYGVPGVSLTVNFSGTYTYTAATGAFTFDVTGDTSYGGAAFRADISGQGTLTNNTMSGTYTGTYWINEYGYWELFDSVSGSFTVTR